MEQPCNISRILPVRTLDVSAIRRDFPILQTRVHGHPLVYLDNAATSQKPRQVIEALSRYYMSQNANIHRGVHYLSEVATAEHEEARERLRRFINAAQTREIIFVRGATEAINLVAQTWGRTHVKSGDEILVTHLEHHANIVPWQMLCEQTGARLRVAPINDAGELLMDEFDRLLNPRTRLVSVTYVSNALGTVNPVSDIIALAHARGVPVLVDGAQAVPHMPVDVQELGCDFFVFSGHKMLGPTGIGVLYGKAARLEAMPPYQGGGDMIRSVSFEKTVYNNIPFKFEAGTPDIGGAIALGVAAEYLHKVGMDLIADYEHDLLEYATQALRTVDRVHLVGTAKRKAGVISFVVEGVHPHDIGTILDQEGIAIRTGHHCAQPVIERLGYDATARASLAFYNTREEIDALVAGLRRVVEVFG
jgi:cysteine desulfurase/selenocysteine lyase